jgi:hypothetical protein
MPEAPSVAYDGSGRSAASAPTRAMRMVTGDALVLTMGRVVEMMDGKQMTKYTEFRRENKEPLEDA